jgi:protein-disulfide isomerase
VEFARQAGAGGDVEACIREERYAGWTARLTDQASKDGVTGTPTVLVAGRKITNSPQALPAAVEAAH